MKRICFVLIVLLLAFVLIPASALADVSADYGWYSETETVYTLSRAADLVGFANIANGTAEGIAKTDFAGKTIKLAAGIDLGGMDWTPIASFAGEFDGNGKTVSNFKLLVDDTHARAGFFNILASGEGVRVHDLTLSDVSATVGNGRCGILANSMQATVRNVTVKNVRATTTAPTAWVGGLCAFISGGDLSGCKVENLNVNAASGAQFIAGITCILQKNNATALVGCNVDGFKVDVTGSGDGCGVGGCIGQTQTGWLKPTLSDCTIKGIDVTARGHVDFGGFVCWPGAHTVATNCHTQGKVDASGITNTECAVGGFFQQFGLELQSRSKRA